MLGSQLEEIVFRSKDVYEFELIEGARNDAVFFSDFASGFDGKTKVLLWTKMKGQHGMCKAGRTGEGFDEEVDLRQLVEGECASFPIWFWRFGGPIEVSEVFDGEGLLGCFGGRELLGFDLPVFLMGGGAGVSPENEN